MNPVVLNVRSITAMAVLCETDDGFRVRIELAPDRHGRLGYVVDGHGSSEAASAPDANSALLGAHPSPQGADAESGGRALELGAAPRAAADGAFRGRDGGMSEGKAWEAVAREAAHALPPCDYGSTRAIMSVAGLLKNAYEMGRSERLVGPALTPQNTTARSMTSAQFVALLRNASLLVNGDIPAWQRRDRCLLENAADRIRAAEGATQGLRQASARLRRERNEARAGIVKADWWNNHHDGEEFYTDPDDALNDVMDGDIVELDGSATVEYRAGFRMPPAPDDEYDNHRIMWFASVDVAEKALAEMRAADQAIRDALGMVRE